MAFVGFWMIPLALGLGVIDKICSFFGFDFIGWLGNPNTMERLLGYFDRIIGVISAAWDFAEPYVTPVVDLIEKFI